MKMTRISFLRVSLATYFGIRYFNCENFGAMQMQCYYFYDLPIVEMPLSVVLLILSPCYLVIIHCRTQSSKQLGTAHLKYCSLTRTA